VCSSTVRLLFEVNLLVHMREQYVLLSPFYREFVYNNCLGNSLTHRIRIENLI